MRRILPMIVLLVTGSAAAAATRLPAEDRYRRAAIEAGEWIRHTAIRTDVGTVWPADPEATRSAPSNLYSGGAGVVLFFLELSRSTGEDSYLEDARSGAAFLIATLPDDLKKPGSAGLYTGVAGTGFVLGELFRTTGESTHRNGALRCLELLKAGATTVGRGVQWSDTSDIISGGAGVGLFLLDLARRLERKDALELATRAGDRLLELADEEEDGLSWRMQPGYDRLMPNFSHGTAGVAFFLARLHQESDEPRFLEAAIGGARRVRALAGGDGSCLLFHHRPGGEQLFYLGYCHGPPGTARLFQQLASVRDDPQWSTWVSESADQLRHSGIPEQRTPGFWNNVGQCCGSAGVASFFLELHRAGKQPADLAFARRLADDLLERARGQDQRLSWIQAEHRLRPDLLVAQTGYMQGAAGIGMLLLQLDAALEGRSDWIRLPDAPLP